MESRLSTIVSTVLLMVPILGCLFLLFAFFSFPPTEWITGNFFEAVINRQMWRVMAFSVDPKGMNCIHYTETAASEYMVQYGGAEVRNVNSTVLGSGGSDDNIQVGRVEFEYRKPGESSWDKGYLQVLTTHDDLGFRYSCGNSP